MRYLLNCMKFLLFFIFVSSSLVQANTALSGNLTATDPAVSTPSTEITTPEIAEPQLEKPASPVQVLESNLVELKRGLFKDAVAALESGDLESFAALKAQSTDYILYPYLEYTICVIVCRLPVTMN